MKTWRKLGRDGKGAERGEGCAPTTPLTLSTAAREGLGQNTEGQARGQKSLNPRGFGKVGDTSEEATPAFLTGTGSEPVINLK